MTTHTPVGAQTTVFMIVFYEEFLCFQGSVIRLTPRDLVRILEVEFTRK